MRSDAALRRCTEVSGAIANRFRGCKPLRDARDPIRKGAYNSCLGVRQSYPDENNSVRGGATITNLCGGRDFRPKQASFLWRSEKNRYAITLFGGFPGRTQFHFIRQRATGKKPLVIVREKPVCLFGAAKSAIPDHPRREALPLQRGFRVEGESSLPAQRGKGERFLPAGNGGLFAKRESTFPCKAVIFSG